MASRGQRRTVEGEQRLKKDRGWLAEDREDRG